MITTFGNLIDTEDASYANKALDYYDGDQLEWVTRALNAANSGRKDWKNRGIVPRYRNLVKMIVDKSGLLFSDGPPKLSVFNGDILNDSDTVELNNELFQADWIEFYTNADSIVRLLKTVNILVQWEPINNHFFFDILHQGNSYVQYGKGTRTVETLVYVTEGDYDDEERTVRVITPEIIQDIRILKNGEEVILNVEINPYGIVPIAVWHDTNTPRCSYWNDVQKDIIQINEMFNLHIIDSEFAASWAKSKTLFTNAKIDTTFSGFTTESEVFGRALPVSIPNSGELIGGPNRIIQFETAGGESPYVEYKGPDVDLEPIDNMFQRWVRDFASDWSVNVKRGDTASATSGFQLIVEEIDNLQLRKKRQRMCETHFRKLFEVMRVIGQSNGISFSNDSTLVAQFENPELPVDSKAEEEMWSLRIKEGRASRVDYFMSTQGMNKDEATAKMNEIDSIRQVNIAQASQLASTSTPANVSITTSLGSIVNGNS